MDAGDERSEISDGVRRFLAERVYSFENLEVLLTLCSDPSRSWSASEVSEKVGFDAQQVLEAFTALMSRQLVVRDGSRKAYRFHAVTPALESTCAELRQLYQRDRFAVVVLLSRLAVQRIRHSAAFAFADAFRVRGPRDGGDSDG